MSWRCRGFSGINWDFSLINFLHVVSLYIGERGHPSLLAPPCGTKQRGGGGGWPATMAVVATGHIWPIRPLGLLGPHGAAGPLMGHLQREAAQEGAVHPKEAKGGKGRVGHMGPMATTAAPRLAGQPPPPLCLVSHGGANKEGCPLPPIYRGATW